MVAARSKEGIEFDAIDEQTGSSDLPDDLSYKHLNRTYFRYFPLSPE